MNNDRLKFRAWVPVSYYDKNGDDKEIMMLIDDVAVYSDGNIGCSDGTMDNAIINLCLSDDDEQSVRDFIENNYATESDVWYFIDSAATIIQQCTGLKSKNGDLIYEGDLVVPWYEPQSEFVIKWDNNSAAFRLWHNDKMIGCPIDNSSISPYVFNSKHFVIKGIRA